MLQSGMDPLQAEAKCLNPQAQRTKASMKPRKVQSKCECQATLIATLDEQRHVLSGVARQAGAEENAPAHSIGANLDRFDIAWLCPFCGRNTLRTFDAGAPMAPLTGAEPR
jgi:hypothetical protein